MQNHTSSPARPEARFSLSLSLLALVAGAGSVWMSMLVWMRFHIEIPVRDVAVLLPFIRTAVQDGLASVPVSDWFALHSGAHRIAIGRVIGYLDYAFFSGKNMAFYVSAAASMLVMAYVFCRVALDSSKQDWARSLLVVGVVFLFLCSPLQYWNYIEPLCATWFYSAMFSALALWLLIQRGRGLTPAAAITVGVLCAGAALSNFSGLILCLLLPVLALLLRSPYWLHLAFSLGLFSVAYLYGLQTDHSNPDINSDRFLTEMARVIGENPEILQGNRPGPDILGVIETIVRSMLLHLGFPLSKYARFAGALLTLSSLLVLGWFWLSLAAGWFRRRSIAHIPPASLFFLAMATFQVAISASIWFGRAAVNHPFAPRYQGITAVYWLSFFLLVLCEVNRRWPARFPAAAATVVVFGIGMSIATIARPVAPFDEKYRHVQQVGILHQLQVEGPAPLLSVKYRGWQAILEREASFVASYSLPLIIPEAYRALINQADEPACENARLLIAPTVEPLVRRIELSFAHGIGLAHTKMFLLDRAGQVGALYPVPPATLYPQALLAQPKTWHGYFKGLPDAVSYHLVIDSAGQLKSCSIKALQNLDAV